MLQSHKRGKHGNYARAAREGRAFLNQRIAEGWLGSRSAGSHGVADVWLINPTTPCWFSDFGSIFHAFPETGIVVSDCFSPPARWDDMLPIQLKSSCADALKAAKLWASGEAQDAWRTTWLRNKGHRKLADKVDAEWFREWRKKHDKAT